jgi:2-dehydro-3-deoxyphosphogluconate aldolase/(4S)-4-hydroxy-2-oxoglutarate aldolase
MSVPVLDRLVAQRVVPVLRLPSAGLARRAAACLADAGFAALEVTLTVPGAVEVIRDLVRALPAGCVIGAGTVLDAGAARRCADAGARFLVSPCPVPGLARVAREAGCVAIIGGFTPGEVLAARGEGAAIVKVFPASTGGPGHVRALHAVFPDILLCPTGGVTRHDMGAYFAAGAALVGVGSDILDLEALEAGDEARATAHARRYLAPPAIAGARENGP